nr:mitochondrial import inner membrane translocase subunit TIM8 [Ipomoea batatas]
MGATKETAERLSEQVRKQRNERISTRDELSLPSLSYSPIVYPRLESAMDASALKSVEMLQFLNEEKQRAMINELVGKIRKFMLGQMHWVQM